jgi:acyl dehydratase
VPDETRDLYFDDLQVGDSFVSRTRILTETDLEAFADISGDHSPIHTDEDYAKTTPFGRRIFHGPFGVAAAMGLYTEIPELTRASLVLTDISAWSFHSPLFVDDHVRLEMTIAELRLTSSGRQGFVQREMRLINGANVLVQSGRLGLLMAVRPVELYVRR